MAALPCVVTPSAREQGERWLDHAGPAGWSTLVDGNRWDPMFGTIAIAEIGCGLFYSLIVTGEFRGRVFSWGDHMLNPPVFCDERSFGCWIEGRLDRLRAGDPVHILDDRFP